MSDHPNAPPPPNTPTPEEIRQWLAFEYSPLVARCAEVTAAINDFLAAHPAIETDEVQGRGADLRDQIRALNKTARAGHDAVKAPLIAAGKATDAWFDLAVAPVKDPLDSLIGAMNKFGNRKLQEEMQARAEAARVAREEADRKAREAAEAMARERAGSDRARLAVTEAAMAQEQAEAAEAAEQVRPAELTRARGEMGGVASLRTVWKWRVTDHELVPRKYMEVVSATVNAAFKAGGRNSDGSPKLSIPGIEAFVEHSV